MNKTRLEVIRINEDVIATSGVTLCSHLNADKPGSSDDHLYVTGDYGTTIAANIYICGDKLTYYTGSYVNSADFVDTIEENKWYYWNGTGYAKCEEQSNDAHPVKPN